jgi:uncharacterized repeat protein (TIGR03803 family)
MKNDCNSAAGVLGRPGIAIAIIAIASLAMGRGAASAQESAIYSFAGDIGSVKDGSNPYAGLIVDSKGNLYGTTESGGNTNYPGDGTVFELSPKTGGGWTETVLYSFGASATDGNGPKAGLVMDSKGNLYGATVFGGANGAGMVFELTPSSTQPWPEKVLYSFGATSTDGNGPMGTLIIDSEGNLYGTTSGGGAYSDGTVFELTPTSTLPWTEKILYNFGAIANDGNGPRAGVIADAKGNLYGTTAAGGSSGDGTVFELLAGTELPWTENILHNFDQIDKDGSTPKAGLIFDKTGNLYGTTFAGGANPSYGGLGAVFELVAEPGGTWSEKVIYSFTGVPDGNYPEGSLVFDADGNLYGTTLAGGDVPFFSNGMVFELTPGTAGNWTETDVYSFGATTGDGSAPTCNLIFDSLGDLYGTTGSGGSGDAGLGGTVFEIKSVATALPVFTPPAGPYTKAQKVAITDTTVNSTIYYTIGGATPTTASTKYTEPIEVSESETISAIAVAADHPNSGVATASYQIGGTTAAPVFSLAGGIYTSGQELFLTDAAPGAAFYYTTNGDTPTTASTRYGGGISVSSNETVKAIAVAPGYLESPVASATYVVVTATAPYERVLYSFGATGNDGGVPIDGVVLDAKGNIYGTTKYGGPHSVPLGDQTVTGGTAFELSPKTGGGWTEKILYNFGAGGDGANPIAGLVLDAKGNLYGTTFQGGADGGGIVFELTPTTSGYWTEKILHNFNNLIDDTDGGNPEAGVVFDSKGNLYGTTHIGGANGQWGTVFKLTPTASGPWTETLLHSFSYLDQSDGYYPEAGVVLDSKGNVYGTTSDGGSAQDLQGGGTVYKLTAAEGANWPETILASFGGGDDTIGYEPVSGLAFDAKGTLFGTNYSGGPGEFGLAGTLFALSTSPGSAGVVDSFDGNGLSGLNPNGTPVFDAQGNLWGTTLNGGGSKDGTVYEWSPASGAYTVYSFDLNGTDGGKPYAGLAMDAVGNLYGTTAYGGTHSTSDTAIVGGTVFEIVTTKTVATPKISPGTGTYSAGQKVTITDATPGATIYYTTDGETPTNSPTKYAGAITVSEDETIKAIAVAPGDNLSAVASATIKVGTPAIGATLAPSGLTFASTGVGSSTAAKKVTLKSTGTSALTIDSDGITITGTGASSFLKATTCGSTLASGASCTISVTFKPAAKGTLTATLKVADNAAGSPQQVTLTGTGLPRQAP